MANIRVQSLASPLDILVDELAEPCFDFRRILIEHPVKPFDFFISKKGPAKIFSEQNEKGVDSQLVGVVAIGVVVGLIACLDLGRDDVPVPVDPPDRDKSAGFHLKGISKVYHLRPDIWFQQLPVLLNVHQNISNVNITMAEVDRLDPPHVLRQGNHKLHPCNWTFVDQTLPVLKDVVPFSAFDEGQGEPFEDTFFEQPVAHPINFYLVKFLLDNDLLLSL